MNELERLGLLFPFFKMGPAKPDELQTEFSAPRTKAPRSQKVHKVVIDDSSDSLSYVIENWWQTDGHVHGHFLFVGRPPPRGTGSGERTMSDER